MSNDFFNNHPMLGSVFDFNRDGSMSPGEAGAMGAIGGMFASEMMRASEEAEREADESRWDDVYDHDSFSSKKGKKKSTRESIYDYEDVDTTSRKAVMKAVNDEDYDGDVECLVEEALDNGVRFRPDDIVEISYLIWDQDLLVSLISTSKPRFLQEDADELASHWGPVELEYHGDAFDEEYSEGGTYYVNTPEEDWL